MVRKIMLAVFWFIVLCMSVLLTAWTVTKTISCVLPTIALCIVLVINMITLVVFLSSWEDIFESEDQQ